MRIELDYDKCIASGACVLACPEVFGQDDDGIVTLLDEDPAPELAEQITKAMRACPAAVIEVARP